MKAQQKAYEYTYRIHWSPDHGGYVASVAEFPAMQSAASPTPHGALTALTDAVQQRLADLDVRGEPRPEVLTVG